MPRPVQADQSLRAAGPTGYIKELRDLIGHRLLLAPGCAIVPIDRGRILLHRRTDSGEWDIIGGFMEVGETFEDTARRELREEVGLEIDWLELIGIYGGTDFTYRYPNGDLTQMAGALFVATVRGDLVADPSEVLEARYFTLDELPAELRPTAQRLLDRHWLQLKEHTTGPLTGAPAQENV